MSHDPRRPPPARTSAPILVWAWPAFRRRDLQPYNALLYEATTRADDGIEVVEANPRNAVGRRAPVIAHLHWPDAALKGASNLQATFKLARLWGILAFLRLRGARVVWTVHNVHPHERHHTGWFKALRWLLTRWVDGTILLSPAHVAPFLETFPGLARRPRAIIPLGHYGPEIDRIRGGTTATAPGTGEPPSGTLRFLFFGRLARYKGVEDLVEAFAGWNDPNARLVLAGLPDDPALSAELQARTATDPRIVLSLRYNSESEMLAMMERADWLVLPYKKIWSSSAALLALSLGCPLLTSDQPTFRDLQREFGVRAVRCYSGTLRPDDLREAGRSRLTPEARRALSTAARSTRDWGMIGRETAAFFRHVAGQPRRPRP